MFIRENTVVETVSPLNTLAVNVCSAYYAPIYYIMYNNRPSVVSILVHFILTFSIWMIRRSSQRVKIYIFIWNFPILIMKRCGTVCTEQYSIWFSNLSFNILYFIFLYFSRLISVSNVAVFSFVNGLPKTEMLRMSHSHNQTNKRDERKERWEKKKK